VERSDNRLFVATLFQSQLSSSSAEQHPVLVGFIGAAADR